MRLIKFLFQRGQCRSFYFSMNRVEAPNECSQCSHQERNSVIHRLLFAVSKIQRTFYCPSRPDQDWQQENMEVHISSWACLNTVDSGDNRGFYWFRKKVRSLKQSETNSVPRNPEQKLATIIELSPSYPIQQEPHLFINKYIIVSTTWAPPFSKSNGSILFSFILLISCSKSELFLLYLSLVSYCTPCI